MTPSFATSLDALGGWRAALGERARRRWLAFSASTTSPTAQAAEQIAALARAPRQREAGRRLRRRVLARQVRADQRDLLRRHRPPHPAGDAGPHDDVPGRARLATATSRHRCCCCRSRRGSRACRSASCAQPRAWRRLRARHRRSPTSSRGRCTEVTRTEWVTRSSARASASGTTRTPDDNPPLDDAGQRRGAGLAPRADQLPAPAAASRAWSCSTRRG